MKWTQAQQGLYRSQVEQLASVMPFDDENRRALLARVTGKASTSDIDHEEMRRVINEQKRLLRQCGFKPKRAPKAERRSAMNQEQYLAHLIGQLGWEGQPERLEGMILRQFGGWKRQLGQLDGADRSKLIAALKQMVLDERAGRMRADRPADARPAPRRDWTPEVVR